MCVTLLHRADAPGSCSGGKDANAWKRAKAAEQKKKRKAKAEEKRWAWMHDLTFFQVRDSAFLARMQA